MIFEVTEYVLFSNVYYDFDKMSAMRLNPLLESFADFDRQYDTMRMEQISVSEGTALTTIRFEGLSDTSDYAYLTMGDKTYNLHAEGSGIFTLTVKSEDYATDNAMVITTVNLEQNMCNIIHVR